MEAGPYLALELGPGLEGGVIEGEGDPPVWVPYVEVADVARRPSAASSGGSPTLEPREGPAGWRSVLEAPAAG